MNQNGIFIVTSKNELVKTILVITIITYVFAGAMYQRGYNDGKQQKQ